MSQEFWISLIVQLCAYGVSFGTIYGTLTTRLKYLEQKVDKHNQVIERTYALEKQVAILQESERKHE